MSNPPRLRRDRNPTRVELLQNELWTKQEFLQPTNQDMRTSNEEVKSCYEKLQSVNEELVTVNAELHTTVSCLSRDYNDMNNLIPGDMGRLIGDIVSNLFGYDKLREDMQAVLLERKAGCGLRCGFYPTAPWRM